jgi:hypothetical protein
MTLLIQRPAGVVPKIPALVVTARYCGSAITITTKSTTRPGRARSAQRLNRLLEAQGQVLGVWQVQNYATGACVRDFPITLDKVLPGLPLVDA